MTHNRRLRKQMAKQMVLTHTIETDGRQDGANQHMVLTHTIETDVFDPYNRNIWSHNSQAAAFCHAWPILLFALVLVLYPLLRTFASLGPSFWNRLPALPRSSVLFLRLSLISNLTFFLELKPTENASIILHVYRAKARTFFHRTHQYVVPANRKKPYYEMF